MLRKALVLGLGQTPLQRMRKMYLMKEKYQENIKLYKVKNAKSHNSMSGIFTIGEHSGFIKHPTTGLRQLHGSFSLSSTPLPPLLPN